MRRKIVTYLCCVLFLFAGVSVFAMLEKEPPEPPHYEKDFDEPPPPGLPIDGGLSLLLIAGAAYGVYAIKKLKDSKN